MSKEINKEFERMFGAPAIDLSKKRNSKTEKSEEKTTQPDNIQNESAEQKIAKPSYRTKTPQTVYGDMPNKGSFYNNVAAMLRDEGEITITLKVDEKSSYPTAMFSETYSVFLKEIGNQRKYLRLKDSFSLERDELNELEATIKDHLNSTIDGIKSKLPNFGEQLPGMKSVQVTDMQTDRYSGKATLEYIASK